MKTNNKILLFLTIFIGILLLLTIDCFGYTYNHFNLKLDGTDEVFFNRSTMELTVNDNVYLITDDSLPSNYTKISVIRESFTMGNQYWICFLPDNSDKLIITNSSNKINNNDFTLYMLSSSDSDFSIYESGSNVFNIDSIVLSNVDVYNQGGELVFQTPPLALEEVLAEGYQIAQETTRQSITAQLVDLVPVGIVILATMIVVSLIAYFRFWRQ